MSDEFVHFPGRQFSNDATAGFEGFDGPGIEHIYFFVRQGSPQARLEK